MLTLNKTFRFEASHVLPQHDGKCARLHGHSWEAEVVLRSDDEVWAAGPKQGMLVDFYDIKLAMQPLLDGYLDHHHLNQTLDVYPTSENVARWLFERLVQGLPLNVRRMLYEVTIRETCTSACTYRP